MRKTVWAVSLFGLFISICIGCSAKSTDNKEDVKQDETECCKEFTSFFAVPGHDINADNDIQKLITEKTGVRVKETWLDDRTADEAIDQMLESGEYPDFVDAGEESVRMYEAGALVALDSYIEKYPNIKALFTEREWDELRQSDGHIYWIPQFSSVYGQDRECIHNGEAFWIQTRVLEWAGYPEVHTMDQYFDLIEEYYAANPTMSDGTQVIPYTILCDDWRYFCLENAPQFLDGFPNDGSVIVDPKTLRVIDYNTTDTAVRYFRKLNEEYKKGIVDPDFFKQSYEEYIKKISSGRVLGMIDQWWDFAYTAEDAIRTAGLDDEGCLYVPLPITIDEGITNQWHTSGNTLHLSSGLAITTACQDVDCAMEFVDALLDQDNHNLRFWGIEGVDYVLDDDGFFKRTAGMRKIVADASYKASHVCQYSYFPQWNGTSRDGKNAMKPEGQEVEFFDGLSDKVRKCLAAYDAQTYVEMLGTNPIPGPWFPMYTYTQTLTTATASGKAWDLMTWCKHNYLPMIVMANNFDKEWEKYMEAYKTCKPENYLNDMQAELNRRVEAASGYEN